MTTPTIQQVMGPKPVEQPAVLIENTAQTLPQPVMTQLEALKEAFSKLSLPRKLDQVPELTTQLINLAEVIEKEKTAIFNEMTKAYEHAETTEKQTNEMSISQAVLLSNVRKTHSAVKSFLSTLVQNKTENSEESESVPTMVVNQASLNETLETIKSMEQWTQRNMDIPLPSPTEISQILNARVVEIDSQALEIRKLEIKSLKTAELVKQMHTLSDKLASLMEKAFNPNEKITIDTIKKQLIDGTEKFKGLMTEYENREKTVQDHLKAFEAQVKEYNEKLVPADHVMSISNFAKVTQEEITKGIMARENVNKARITEHDQLAKEWSDVLTIKEKIEWQLKRIEIYANIYTDASKLGKKLGGLATEIENLKFLLRTNEPQLRSQPDELKKFCETQFLTHGKLIHIFNDHKELAKTGNYLKAAEEALNVLQPPKSKNAEGESKQKNLKDRLGEIHVYSKEIKESINKTADENLKTIKEERADLLNKFKVSWENVFKLLDKEDTQTSLTYEINRLGYCLELNHCRIPTDTFYKAKVYGWIPKEYVSSAWEEKKDAGEKKVASV